MNEEELIEDDGGEEEEERAGAAVDGRKGDEPGELPAEEDADQGDRPEGQGGAGKDREG